MIHWSFIVRNPWGNRFDNIRCWSGSTPFANKFWELQLYKSTDLIAFTFHLTHRQDHAGLRLDLALFGYNLDFGFYDRRHWDHDTQSWHD